MMRIIVLVFFLISLNQISNAIPISTCTDNSQCITNRNCSFCPQGTGPRCTKPICINGRCGTIEQCSVTLGGKCSTGGGCITNDLCRVCEENMGPPCVESMCIDEKCVLIQPCTIPVN